MTASISSALTSVGSFVQNHKTALAITALAVGSIALLILGGGFHSTSALSVTGASLGLVASCAAIVKPLHHLVDGTSCWRD